MYSMHSCTTHCKTKSLSTKYVYLAIWLLLEETNKLIVFSLSLTCKCKEKNILMNYYINALHNNTKRSIH